MTVTSLMPIREMTGSHFGCNSVEILVHRAPTLRLCCPLRGGQSTIQVHRGHEYRIQGFIFEQQLMGND